MSKLENYVCCNLFDATRKCSIKLNYNLKIFNKIKLQLDKLVATDMIFS